MVYTTWPWRMVQCPRYCIIMLVWLPELSSLGFFWVRSNNSTFASPTLSCISDQSGSHLRPIFIVTGFTSLCPHPYRTNSVSPARTWSHHILDEISITNKHGSHRKIPRSHWPQIAIGFTVHGLGFQHCPIHGLFFFFLMPALTEPFCDKAIFFWQWVGTEFHTLHHWTFDKAGVLAALFSDVDIWSLENAISCRTSRRSTQDGEYDMWSKFSYK